MFLWHSLLCVQTSLSFAISPALKLCQSFLGMNIADSSPLSSTKNNTTSSSSSAACSSSASVSCSQGKLWNMSAFGILSGSILLVTLFVPVIIDPIMRWLLRSWFPHLTLLLRFTMMLTVVTVLVVFRESFWLANTEETMQLGSLILSGLYPACISPPIRSNLNQLLCVMRNFIGSPGGYQLSLPMITLI